MKILIPIQLRKITNAQELDIPKGNMMILSELFDYLCTEYDGFEERMFDEQQNIRKFINVYINDNDIRFLNGEYTEIKEDDVISIIAATAGG